MPCTGCTCIVFEGIHVHILALGAFVRSCSRTPYPVEVHAVTTEAHSGHRGFTNVVLWLSYTLSTLKEHERYELIFIIGL